MSGADRECYVYHDLQMLQPVLLIYSVNKTTVKKACLYHRHICFCVFTAVKHITHSDLIHESLLGSYLKNALRKYSVIISNLVGAPHEHRETLRK
jgi:hypothetical protein